LSYRRNDSAGYTGRLHDRLREHFGDTNLFRDIDGVAPGVDFVNKVLEMVGICDVLVAVIGKQWLSEKNRQRLHSPEDLVRVEIQTGLERGIAIIPLLVDGATMPKAELLPKALANFARRQALEISDNRFDFDVDRLIQVIEGAFLDIGNQIQRADIESATASPGTSSGVRASRRGFPDIVPSFLKSVFTSLSLLLFLILMISTWLIFALSEDQAPLTGKELTGAGALYALLIVLGQGLWGQVCKWSVRRRKND